jgi:signal transduction histidine kinase
MARKYRTLMTPPETTSAHPVKSPKARPHTHHRMAGQFTGNFTGNLTGNFTGKTTNPLKTKEEPHSEEEMHALFARLDKVRENERKRLAREIHDDLGQKLSLLRYEVVSLGMNRKARLSGMLEASNLLLKQIDDAIHSVRAIVTDLRPAVLDLGLVAGIEWLAQEFRRQTEISFRLRINCCQINLGDDRATTIFRIVQESLTNIVRHAKASQIDLAMEMHENCVHIEVADNGIGMPANALAKIHSTGIAGMRERIRQLHGEISIASQPGKGTTLTFKIPLCERRNGRAN